MWQLTIATNARTSRKFGLYRSESKTKTLTRLPINQQLQLQVDVEVERYRFATTFVSLFRFVMQLPNAITLNICTHTHAHTNSLKQYQSIRGKVENEKEGKGEKFRKQSNGNSNLLVRLKELFGLRSWRMVNRDRNALSPAFLGSLCSFLNWPAQACNLRFAAQNSQLFSPTSTKQLRL